MTSSLLARRSHATFLFSFCSFEFSFLWCVRSFCSVDCVCSSYLVGPLGAIGWLRALLAAQGTRARLAHALGVDGASGDDPDGGGEDGAALDAGGGLGRDGLGCSLLSKRPSGSTPLGSSRHFWHASHWAQASSASTSSLTGLVTTRCLWGGRFVSETSSPS